MKYVTRIRKLVVRAGRYAWGKRLDIFLCLLFAVCAALIATTGAERYPAFADAMHLGWLAQLFPSGNQVLFELSIGVMTGLFVYVLVVRFPERSKKRRLKNSLHRQFYTLKEQCILNCLWACNVPAESDLIERLHDRSKFKEFFQESVGDGQTRWHAVLNGLDNAGVQRIVLELNIFRREVEFTLGAIDVPNQAAFNFLRGLTQVLGRSKTWSDGYDEIKPLAQFLWHIHTGWSVFDGYSKHDVVRHMIESI